MRSAGLVLATLALGGCASFAGIHTQSSLLQLQQNTAADSVWFPQQAWWQTYQDAQLDALMQQALAASPDVKIALSRVRRAQAAAAEADSALFPQLGAAASVTRERLSENDIYPPPLGGAVVDSATVRATAQWQLDLFGKNRATLDAAIGQTRAAEADAQAARVLLTSQVAQGYFNLARLQAQQRLDAVLLAQREHSLQLVQLRVGAGLDSTLAQRQAQAEVPQIRAHSAALAEQIALQRHALAALLGAEPAATVGLNAALPRTPLPQPPTQISAELLGHRADVAAARWRVESDLRGIDAAKAGFYPNINLSAFIGFDAIGLSNWLTAGSRTLGLAPAISLPIFDAGRLRAQLKGRTAQTDEAIEQYNTRVLAALREVADALSSWRALQLQLGEQRAVTRALDSASALALQRYQAGLSNYLTVLTAQSAALEQQRTLLDLQVRAYSLNVALIQSLGGGYTAPATTSSLTHSTITAQPAGEKS
jgi:NodT family efflux transporter outer membrane factor (OMF) lipoprotein